MKKSKNVLDKEKSSNVTENFLETNQSLQKPLQKCATTYNMKKIY